MCMQEMPEHSLLAASFNTLYKISQKQFSRNFGLHLNSADWKPYIDKGTARFYNFLRTGVLTTYTTTTNDGRHKRHDQVIQFSEYKLAETTILLCFLCGVPEQEITDFLITFYFNSRTKLFCDCEAFKFWGFEYILTRKGSVFGEGEYRYPKIRNPRKVGVVCKHLWVILEALKKKELQIVEGIVPFYKKVYGLDNQKRFEKYRKELGKIGRQEILQEAREIIPKTKSETIRKAFNLLDEKYFKNMDKRKRIKKPELQDQKSQFPSGDSMLRAFRRITKPSTLKEDWSDIDTETLGWDKEKKQ